MKLATNWTEEAAPVVEQIDGKPAIELPGNGLLLGDFAAELGRLLAGAGVFARQGCAFTLDHQGQKLEAITPGWLRTWIEKHVVPYKAERNNDIVIKRKRSISEDTAKAVTVSPQFLAALPRVERFNPCPMPTMRDDGTIELLLPGLDAESSTFTADSGFSIEPMPLNEAVYTLNDLLSEFAWPADKGRALAVQVAAMLTVFAGGILPRGTLIPAFIFLANAEGAGKTLLAMLCGVPYANLPAAESAPRDEAEWQKKLLALVVSGRRLMVLDNLKGHLDSASLEAYVTSPFYGGRILGVTKEFSGEAGAVVLITGNRLTISADMRRRSLLVELFMNEFRAEDRKFRRILDPAAIPAMRPRIVSALWSIVRAWDEAGRPPCSHTNASFPRWAQTIGGMVEFVGFGSPLVPAEIEGMGDTETADMSALVANMQPGKRYRFEAVAVMADEAGLFEHVLLDRDKEGGLTRRSKAAFAKLLARYDRRRVSASGIFAAEGKGKSRRYILLAGNGGHAGDGVSLHGENENSPKGPKDHADHVHHVGKGAAS